MTWTMKIFSLSIWKLKQKNRKLSNKLRTDHLIMRVGIFWNNRRPRVKFNSSHWTTTIQLDLNAYSKITTHVFLDLTFLSYYSFVLLKLFRLVLRGARCPLIPINTSKIKPHRWRLRCLGAAFQSLVKCQSQINIEGLIQLNEYILNVFFIAFPACLLIFKIYLTTFRIKPFALDT